MKRPVTFLLVASMLISASALADGMSRGSQKKIAQVVASNGGGGNHGRRIGPLRAPAG